LLENVDPQHEVSRRMGADHVLRVFYPIAIGQGTLLGGSIGSAAAKTWGF
jgi:hypothetical protein